MRNMLISNGMERVSKLTDCLYYLDKNSISMNFYKKFRETQLIDQMSKQNN